MNIVKSPKYVKQKKCITFQVYKNQEKVFESIGPNLDDLKEFLLSTQIKLHIIIIIIIFIIIIFNLMIFFQIIDKLYININIVCF